jgi:mercuric ion transport protein
VSTRDKITVPRIDLIFDNGCPNVDDARALLTNALAEAGLQPTWREWERAAAETPAELRGLGSPSILVDGVDVSGADSVHGLLEHANCCRIYENGGRFRGVPAVEVLTAALSRGRTTR